MDDTKIREIKPVAKETGGQRKALDEVMEMIRVDEDFGHHVDGRSSGNKLVGVSSHGQVAYTPGGSVEASADPVLQLQQYLEPKSAYAVQFKRMDKAKEDYLYGMMMKELPLMSKFKYELMRFVTGNKMKVSMPEAFERMSKNIEKYMTIVKSASEACKQTVEQRVDPYFDRILLMQKESMETNLLTIDKLEKLVDYQTQLLNSMPPPEMFNDRYEAKKVLRKLGREKCFHEINLLNSKIRYDWSMKAEEALNNIEQWWLITEMYGATLQQKGELLVDYLRTVIPLYEQLANYAKKNFELDDSIREGVNRYIIIDGLMGQEMKTVAGRMSESHQKPLMTQITAQIQEEPTRDVRGARNYLTEMSKAK
jgi:hypothetical protein